jgi:hypothetical protein
VARGVDQVELIELAVLGPEVEPDRLGLDGDAPLPLEIQLVEELLGPLPLADRAGHIQDPVGKGALAVVDVRDDREVADAAGVDGHHGHERLRLSGQTTMLAPTPQAGGDVRGRIRGNDWGLWVAIMAAWPLLTLAGCKDGKSTGDVPEGSRGDDSRQECVTPGADVNATDVNGDGRDDIRHVRVDGVRRCTEIDLNFDGQTDLTRFYASDGETVVREEHDFDFDGRLDQITFFEDGRIARKELDTNFNNHIDTWLWCEGGRVERAERDRRGNGEVDTWEFYENGLLAQAAYDENNDGKPERWELFREGRLAEVRRDTTFDGKADQKERVPANEAGPADEPLRCALEDLREAGTSGGEADASDAEAADVEPPQPFPDAQDAASVVDEDAQ